MKTISAKSAKRHFNKAMKWASKHHRPLSIIDKKRGYECVMLNRHDFTTMQNRLAELAGEAEASSADETGDDMLTVSIDQATLAKARPLLGALGYTPEEAAVEAIRRMVALYDEDPTIDKETLLDQTVKGTLSALAKQTVPHIRS